MMISTEIYDNWLKENLSMLTHIFKKIESDISFEKFCLEIYKHVEK